MRMHHNSQIERIGVQAVGEQFVRVGYIFREQQTDDYGIDAQIEIVAGGLVGCIPILQRSLNNQASCSRHQGLDGLEPSATFEGNPQIDDILCPWRTPMLPTALHARLQHGAVRGFHGAATDHQATRPVLAVSHPIHIVAVIGLERLPRLPRRFGQGDELAQGFQHLGDVPGMQLGFLAFQPALPPRFIWEHHLGKFS